jgi:hypothetical protein
MIIRSCLTEGLILDVRHLPSRRLLAYCRDKKLLTDLFSVVSPPPTSFPCAGPNLRDNR